MDEGSIKETAMKIVNDIACLTGVHIQKMRMQ